ncbi:MAG: hypothetical protein IJ855_05690 [Bacteroidales bacterium]|nr:hypothetical protein [Bacteroidales bacterium]
MFLLLLRTEIYNDMHISCDIPQIAALKGKVEEIFGSCPQTHTHFQELISCIEVALKEHMSESTLERLWGYSTRENKRGTVSLRTLDVLSKYCGFSGWEDFCASLRKRQLKESGFFEGETVLTISLKEGARLRIGWMPDRICVIRYLGDNLFEVESAENTSLEKGDYFKVLQFQKGRPLYLEEFSSVAGSYVLGLEHGLTTLQVLK